MGEDRRPQASGRDQFAQLLRHLLGRAGLTQATLARRLRHHGFPNITEPRVVIDGGLITTL